jgi:hypothetical protein
MAKEPKVIPFAESMPSDDFQIEEIGNNEVLIGDPALDQVKEIDTTFNENLAETIDENELVKKAGHLVQSGKIDTSKV